MIYADESKKMDQNKRNFLKTTGLGLAVMPDKTLATAGRR